jgi:hypothetical protein
VVSIKTLLPPDCFLYEFDRPAVLIDPSGQRQLAITKVSRNSLAHGDASRFPEAERIRSRQPVGVRQQDERESLRRNLITSVDEAVQYP